MGHARAGKASKQGQAQHQPTQARDKRSLKPAAVEAQAWLRVERYRRSRARVESSLRSKMGEKFAAFTGRDRTQVIEMMMLDDLGARSKEEREQEFDEIVDEMPRRLRRALGDRSYSQAGRKMVVPKGKR